jgi:hypothetical protein
MHPSKKHTQLVIVDQAFATFGEERRLNFRLNTDIGNITTHIVSKRCFELYYRTRVRDDPNSTDSRIRNPGTDLDDIVCERSDLWRDSISEPPPKRFDP